MSQTFDAYRRSIRAFYDDDGASLMMVFVAPEAQGVAAKLFASVEAEKTSYEVTFAYAGPFTDADSYYRAAADAILANLAEHAEALAQEGITIEPPGTLDLELATSSSELRFADFVERCSRALWPRLARRTVVLLCADPALTDLAEAQTFNASTRALASLAAPERTKFVVFAPQGSEPVSEAAAPQRLNVAAPRTPKHKAQVLHGFFAGSARRVLVLSSEAGASTSAREELRLAAQEAHFASTTVSVALRPAALPDLAEAACGAVREQAGEQRVTLPERSQHLSPVDAFAHLCEAWAHAAKAGRCTVVLSLGDFDAKQLDVARKFVLALNRAACSSRVRYVLLREHRDAELFPVLEEAPRRVASLHVRPDAAGMEADLQAKLDDPKLPVPERVQCLIGLAALANTRRDFPLALRLNESALGWADQAGVPSLPFLVWLSIGQSFYAQQLWEPAETAYSNALSTCLDHSLPAGIAQSTLSLADTLLCAGKLADAVPCYQSAVDWYDKLSAPLFACHALTWLGEAQRRAKDPRAAEQTWLATLERYAALGPDFHDATVEGKKQVLARLVALLKEDKNQGAAKRHDDSLRALGDAPILCERP